MEEKGGNGFLDILILLLALLFCVGPQTVFPACLPKPDGSWMMCHMPNLLVTGAGGLCVLFAMVRFFMGNRFKMMLSAAIFAVSFLAMPVPGYLLPLCRLATMQCQAIFRPAVIFVGVFICVVTGIDIWIRLRKE